MRTPFLLALVGLFISTSAFGQVATQLYPAPTAPVAIADSSLGTSIDTVRTADGLLLHGIERAPRDGKPLLLVFHGNESSAMESIHWLEPLVREGYGIVAAEYRGYSANPGTPSEKGLEQDADAFCDRARELAGGSKLIVVGHSLGAGVAFGVSAHQRFDGLVTVGAFTRLTDLVPKEQRGSLTDAYDNMASVAALEVPLYLVHGTADDTVPFAQAEELREAAVRAKKVGALFRVRDGGHAPEGPVVVMILKAIATKLENGGRTVSVTLPSNVTVEAF